jgi:8-oxo-dGTP pyrophosphatase MutT (NUDIX family)
MHPEMTQPNKMLIGSVSRGNDGLPRNRQTGDSDVSMVSMTNYILTYSAAALRELEEEGGVKPSKLCRVYGIRLTTKLTQCL